MRYPIFVFLPRTFLPAVPLSQQDRIQGEAEEFLLGAQPFLGPSLHEGRVPQRQAEDNYAPLGVGRVASPHLIAQFHDPRRSGACFGNDDPCLAQIGRDAARLCYCAHRGVEGGSSPGRHLDHVKVAQESDKILVIGMERFRRLLKGIVLSEGEKRGGEGVPLLTALALGNVPATTCGVPPAVRGRAPVKQAHEREQFRHHLAEFAEEGRPRHAVVYSAAVQRHQNGASACRKGRTHMDCIGSSSSLQGELERPRGMVELVGPFPGECFRD